MVSSKFYLRTEPLQWLARCTQFSNIVAISGMKGVGKTTLVRSWLQGRSATPQDAVKWHTAARFSSISALLEKPDLTVERALETSSVEWQKFSVMVWDDVHLFNPSHLGSLISFLTYQASGPLHILLSDESLSSHLGPEVPQLRLDGFSEIEVDQFLKNFKVESTPELAKDLKKKSGGLPLLLQLWMQDPSKIKNFSLGHLSDDEKTLLSIFSFWRRSFSESDATKIADKFPAGELLQKLQSRFLLEKKTDAMEFEISPFLKELILSQLSASEENSWAQRSLKVLMQKPEASHAEVFISALQAGDVTIISDAALKCDLNLIDDLNPDDSGVLIKWLDKAMHEVDGTQIADQIKWRLRRFKLGIEIVSGDRDNALKAALKTISQETQTETDERDWYVYETLNWLNRSEKFKESQELLTKVSDGLKAPLSYFLHIEKSVPYVYSDPKRAIEGLSRVRKSLSHLNVDAISNQDTREILALAHASYQTAVAYQQIRSPIEAIENYNLARKCYSALGRKYFEAFCYFNIANLMLGSGQHQALDEVLPKLSAIANRYGYNYLKALSSMISGLQAMNSLKFFSALENFNLGLSVLPKSVPKRSRLNLLLEKARALRELGYQQKLLQTWNEISSVMEEPSRKKRTEIELGIKPLSVEELSEQWSSLGGAPSEEFYLKFLLERGVDPQITNLSERCQSSNRLGVAKTQFDLLQALRSNEEEQIWHVLQSFENQLRAFADPMPEKIAVQCLLAALNENPATRDLHLENAELELSRWSADAEFKTCFQIWLKATRASQSPLDTLEWRRLRVDERERWSAWIVHLQKKKTEAFTVKTFEKELEVNSYDDLLSTYQLVVVEHLGLVYFRDKPIKPLSQKPQLRKILIMLLEMAPEPVLKPVLANAIWGETYSPLTHDARIYTSIQRLREILGEKSIENWESGYRLKREMSFALVKSNDERESGGHKVRALIIESLKKHRVKGEGWLRRADLVEATNSSDATIKRILSQLQVEGVIERQGQGTKVTYRIV